MRDGVDTFQVAEAVVSADVVLVVNLISVRDRAVSLFPDQTMLADDASVIKFDLRVSVAADPACLGVSLHGREIGPGASSRSIKSK